ncbi:MAG: hypothetical protein QUS35_00370 [bacterium]|nr:hypothetical protein [bacterium]
MTLRLSLFTAWPDPVTATVVDLPSADAARLDVRLLKAHSSGILEWTVE